MIGRLAENQSDDFDVAFHACAPRVDALEEARFVPSAQILSRLKQSKAAMRTSSPDITRQLLTLTGAPAP
jgi:hypothetical protein